MPCRGSALQGLLSWVPSVTFCDCLTSSILSYGPTKVAEGERKKARWHRWTGRGLETDSEGAIKADWHLRQEAASGEGLGESYSQAEVGMA